MAKAKKIIETEVTDLPVTQEVEAVIDVVEEVVVEEKIVTIKKEMNEKEFLVHLMHLTKEGGYSRHLFDVIKDRIAKL
jgi:hypothetical protein